MRNTVVDSGASCSIIDKKTLDSLGSFTIMEKKKVEGCFRQYDGRNGHRRYTGSPSEYKKCREIAILCCQHKFVHIVRKKFHEGIQKGYI